jgi:hypothetical protein
MAGRRGRLVRPLRFALAFRISIPDERTAVNTPEDIRRYREEGRESLFLLAQWAAQTIVTPGILLIILWRLW